MKMKLHRVSAPNDKPFAAYWMHNGFLNIDNKKMSKSLGNFFTVRDIAEKYDLQVLRFLHAQRPITAVLLISVPS